MKRTSLVFLVVSVSVLALTPLMSAHADVQLPAYIKFRGYAVGTCLVVRGIGFYAMLHPEWYGNASGSIALEGYAKATSYNYYEANGYGPQIEGWAYSTAPDGHVKAVGFLSVRWFENNELHQLLIAIYSKPTSQGIFQPETDTFIAGLPWGPGLPPPGWEEPLLGLRGIYKVGPNFQFISGSIGVFSLAAFEARAISVGLWFGDNHMMILWVSELVEAPASWGGTVTIPAATILWSKVELLEHMR